MVRDGEKEHYATSSFTLTEIEGGPSPHCFNGRRLVHYSVLASIPSHAKNISLWLLGLTKEAGFETCI